MMFGQYLNIKRTEICNEDYKVKMFTFPFTIIDQLKTKE